MAWDTWLIYLVAVVGLSLAPGPNGLLALTHGALYGHRKTLFTVTGGIIGFVLLIALSMLGIGALLQASAEALTLLKWLGGAYLVWIGIQLWRSPGLQLTTDAELADKTAGSLLKSGFLTALSNPKVLLFFGAFLPQFIDPTRDLIAQFAMMALTFAAVEFFVEYLLARVAYSMRPRLERHGRRFNRACGGFFLLLGCSLPITR